MTMRMCEAIRQPDVVTLLHQEFGPARSWRDLLSDCIRGRGSFHGHVLMPVAHDPDSGRPLYDRRDVDRFIVEVRRVLSPKPIEVLHIRVDDSVAWIPPRARQVEILGSSTLL